MHTYVEEEGYRNPDLMCRVQTINSTTSLGFCSFCRFDLASSQASVLYSLSICSMGVAYKVDTI